MGKLTEQLERAQTAIYVEKWQRILCGNCLEYRSTHVQDHCLFEATTFKPVSYEVLRKIARKMYTRNSDMIVFIKQMLAREESNGVATT